MTHDLQLFPTPQGLMLAGVVIAQRRPDGTFESESCVANIQTLLYPEDRSHKAMACDDKKLRALRNGEYVDGAMALETNVVERLLEDMGSFGISRRITQTRIIMEIDDTGVRDKLAFAALQSEEWRRTSGHLHLTNTIEERTHKKDFKKMNALVSKLLLSTGAFMPLEKILKEGNLKIKGLDVDQVETVKFSTLHISSPEVEAMEDVYVPVHAYYSITLEKI